jgi:hypothetical protein
MTACSRPVPGEEEPAPRTSCNLSVFQVAPLQGRYFSAGRWRCRRFSATLGAFLLRLECQVVQPPPAPQAQLLRLLPSREWRRRFRFWHFFEAARLRAERQAPHLFHCSWCLWFSESSRHALGTSLVGSLTKFYSCLYQTLSRCNTSTPPPSFWVRWQGWPIPPPLHFREEAISLKHV